MIAFSVLPEMHPSVSLGKLQSFDPLFTTLYNQLVKMEELIWMYIFKVTTKISEISLLDEWIQHRAHRSSRGQQRPGSPFPTF